MKEVRVRDAVSEDAPFLAEAILAADRGHTAVGSWDEMLPGPDEERLGILAALVAASQPSFVHWSTFLVAEIDDRLAGTVAGYTPGEMTVERFAAACREALGGDAMAQLNDDGAWSRDYFTVNIPDDTVRVEWVYVHPDFRARGVSSRLIARLLDNARSDGIATAHISAYIGNDAATAVYRRAGFEEFAECRHADYERRFRTPGQVFLRRSL